MKRVTISNYNSKRLKKERFKRIVATKRKRKLIKMNNQDVRALLKLLKM